MNSFVPLFNLATAVSPEDPSFQVSIVTPTTKVSGRLWSCECDGVTSSAVCGEFLTGTTKPVTLKPPLQHLQQGKLFPTQPAPCHSLGTACRCQHFAWSIPCHCRIWHHLWVSVIISAKGPWIWALLQGLCRQIISLLLSHSSNAHTGSERYTESS